MKIAIACDHGGLALKTAVTEWLSGNGYEVVDFGTNSSASCDYPDFGVKAAEAVASGECTFGVVVCTTGIGISIAANKVKGVRCALCSEPLSAKMTRLHNNANMLAFGGRVEYKEDPIRILDSFIDSSFAGGRHQRRIDKISALEG